MKNPKDKITNVIAYLLVIVGAIQTYLSVNAGEDINWGQLALYIGAAICSYLTGKDTKGNAKVINEETGFPVKK